jgi:serine/threonine-protein kinase
MTTEPTDPAKRHLGRYVIYDEIARGGMGTVHVGRLLGPVGFRKLVAVKRMSPLLASDPETVRRFQAEAAVTARVLHPSVVSTLDIVAEQGELFLIMELVRGDSLARLLAVARERSEPVPVSVALAIMTSVLAGLHAAHEATDEEGRPLGLVHCDVSPQNILVGLEGLARIADFGIARSRFEPAADQGRRLRGKARYLAPEQLDYDTVRVDRRSDIFAAAAVLWEMLAGRPLFDGDDTASIIEKILAGEVPALRSLRADVPASLDVVIERALGRAPESRQSTAAELAEALEATGVGLASQRAVAGWVDPLAADRVGRLDAIIRQAERLGVPPAASSEEETEAPTVIVEKRTTERGAVPIDSSGSEASPTRTFTLDVPRPDPPSSNASPAMDPPAFPTDEAAPRRSASRWLIAAAGAGLVASVAFISFRADEAPRDQAAARSVSPGAPSASAVAAATPAPTSPAASSREERALPSASEEPKQIDQPKPRSSQAWAPPPRASSPPPRPTQAPRADKPYVADRP